MTHFCYFVLVEKFACVTILFSDIVSFTTISAAVQPMDIVNMLNELYSKFDKCTNENDVYKVRYPNTLHFISKNLIKKFSYVFLLPCVILHILG